MSETFNGDRLPTKNRFLQPKFLFVAATVWHVSVAMAVFAVGKYQLIPSQVYPSGIARFASDGIVYQDQCVELCAILKNEGVAAWATWPTQLHIRLYSLPLSLFSRWVSFNILTIEPLNLIYYLAILALTFKIGEAIFDYRSGLIAATVVGLWPSFVLHTTQLLRDPLLILSVLIVAWCVVESLRADLPWRRALLLGAATIVAIVCIRIVRLPMWYVLCATVVLAILLLIIRAVAKRQIVVGTVIFAVMIGAAILVTPRFQSWFHNQQELRTKRLISPEELQKLPINEQIAARREGWKFRSDREGNVLPADDGSRIDPDVKLRTFGDILRHVPRATAVGLFAPFPNMWLQSGHQVGYGGRIVSGFETIFTYMIECLALIGLWRGRKNFSVWFLTLIIGFGAVGLGLVVNNIGALYRLRYPFWVMLVIVGAGGVICLFGKFSLRTRSHIF